MDANLLQGFYLNELFIEPLKGHVSGKNVSRHLTPKAGEVLLRLAQHPGDLVTREALLNEAWGHGQGTTEALSHAISELRNALGDDPEEPRFVQTVPRRGYRLIPTPVPARKHTESIVIGASQSHDELGLFENLSRRGVFETALAYLVFGWLIIQVADIVFDQLLLPAWAGTFVTALVIAGFPIALVLSWFLEFRDGRAVLQEVSPRDDRRRRFSRTYISVVGALALASILVFLYDRQFGLPTRTEPERTPVEAATIPIVENSIAVLPFLNLDGSEETQVFANGLVDDVIHRLARVPGLRVSSRGDSFSLSPNSSSAVVRKRLRVAMYIEGSVEIASNSIRVIVQLINSADGFHMQSRTFDHPLEDFFRLRDEITQLTVSSLRVALPEDTQAISRVSARNPSFDAYVLYRRGIDELYKPGTVDALASALGWMDAALEVDPQYAAAFAGKCSAYIGLFRETDDPELIGNAEQSCADALELNPNLDVVHNALGDLYHMTGDYKRAEAAFMRALQINPQSAASMTAMADVFRLQNKTREAEKLYYDAIELQPGNWRSYNALGAFYYRQGRYAEAADQFSRVVSLDDTNIRGLSNLGTAYMLAGNFAAAAPVFARSIDLAPQASTYSSLGLMHYYLGRYVDAEAALRSGIELAPNDHLMWMNLGDVLANARRDDDARQAFNRAQELVGSAIGVNPNDPNLMMDAAWIEAMLGNEQKARAAIAAAAGALPEDPYVDYVAALIHHRFGETDEAIRALRSAIDKGYSTVILAAEPHLRELRQDPRFKSLVESDPG